MAYVPLVCQSHHSPGGVASPGDLVRRARGLGYNTFGLCDAATIAGYHVFDQACRNQGIRPVFGCRFPVACLIGQGRSYPIDFLIESEQGYRNLIRLLTVYHNEGKGGCRLLTPEDLHDRTQGLIAVVPCDGELSALLGERDRSQTEQFLVRAVELMSPDVKLGIAALGETAEHGQLIHRLGRFAGLHAIAAPIVRYPEPGDAATAVFLDHPEHAPERSFKPPADLKVLPALWPEDDEIARWKGDLEEVPHAAGEVARRCTWRPTRIRHAFPVVDLERGFDVNSYLFDLVIRGATQRYGEITEDLKQRINREFEDVKANNLAPYLLLNYQIMQAIDECGIPRGVGRGRMVASVLAYCLGITRIDPRDYGLNPRGIMGENQTCPAISIEVPRGRVDELLDWIRKTYGEERLVEIGRIQDLRRDQMINELAAWAGMTDEERRIAQRDKARLRSAGAAQRLGELAEQTRSRRWRDPAFLADLAARLAPRPRAWQATGDRWALSGESLDCVVPRVAAGQGRPVTGIEEAAIDRLGLARLAFVPHGLLDILAQAVYSTHAQDPSLELRHIPLDDRETFDLLGRGDTLGIPPLERVTLQCLLRRQKPRNLQQLRRLMAEADHGRHGDRPREISEQIPDVLLSYQCAYFKTHYPLAFFSAAIGAVIERRSNPSALMCAARRAGFETLAPDINLSDWGTTVHGESIRLGLSAVRHFGQRAWENVLQVRSGGNFTSLENFCERVDNRIFNLRSLRTLIASGAMDDLGENRATMDAAITRLQRHARERAAEREGGQATLFDLDEWADFDEGGDATENDATEEWNFWERLSHEHDALGFYLSIDPIERFKIAIEHLAPLRIDRLTNRSITRAIRIAGLICQIEESSPLIDPEAEVLIDMEGLPAILPKHLVETTPDWLRPMSEVLVMGRLVEEEGCPILHADGVWGLGELEDQATRVARIELDLAGENRYTLKLLKRLADQFPGKSELIVKNYAGWRGWTWRRLRRAQLFFCSPLYQGLRKILAPEAIDLFGAEGERLVADPPKTEALDDEAEGG